MKIWQLSFELDDYDNLVPIKEFTVEEIQSIDGAVIQGSGNLFKLKEWSLRKGLS